MANSKIPGPIGTYPIRIDSGTLSRTNMPQPGVIGVMNQASYAKVDHAKRALAIDIGQLILDITGIFDPSPISDGTNLLISLARGNWVDAVTSAVSIAPYIGDLSKTAKLPRYIKSVREAIHIAKFDFKWANALRTLFTKLTKVLDECIKLAADMLPNSAKTQLKELKYEVDKFLDPIGGTTNKLADGGKKADFRPGSNSTKSQRNIDRAKPPEKLDKKPEKGYGSDKNNGPKTTAAANELKPAKIETVKKDAFELESGSKKTTKSPKSPIRWDQEAQCFIDVEGNKFKSSEMPDGFGKPSTWKEGQRDVTEEMIAARNGAEFSQKMKNSAEADDLASAIEAFIKGLEK